MPVPSETLTSRSEFQGGQSGVARPPRSSRGPCPSCAPKGGTLVFQWDTVKVAIRVDVGPMYSFAMPAADAAPITGQWDVIMKESGKDVKSVWTLDYRDGKAVRFEARGFDDRVWATGSRRAGK